MLTILRIEIRMKMTLLYTPGGDGQVVMMVMQANRVNAY